MRNTELENALKEYFKKEMVLQGKSYGNLMIYSGVNSRKTAWNLLHNKKMGVTTFILLCDFLHKNPIDVLRECIFNTKAEIKKVEH